MESWDKGWEAQKCKLWVGLQAELGASDPKDLRSRSPGMSEVPELHADHQLYRRPVGDPRHPKQRIIKWLEEINESPVVFRWKYGLESVLLG